MKTPQARRLLLPLLLLALIAGGWYGTGAKAQNAGAGQPASVNPTASSVKEKQLLDALKPGGAGPQTVNGRVSIPDKRSGNLIQPEGQQWRVSHQDSLPLYGGLAILAMIAGVALFYFLRGTVRIEGGRSGVTITRFNSVERFAHWLTAVSFLALGLTGLNLTFGRSLVLPLIGPEAFSGLTQFGKYVHNYGSFAFTLGLLLMFLVWIKDNIPHPRDIVWMLKGGGMFGAHVEAARFNAGQKVIFWVVILGGAALAYTGYTMMSLIGGAGIADLQSFTFWHGMIGALMLAVIVAHVYIGTVGMEGAFEAMGRGTVDWNWAKSHHSIWAKREQDKLAKSMTPAE